MHLSSRWLPAVDALVESILREGGIDRPPVDAIALAERLGMLVAFDDRQSGRARFSRLGGLPSILLKRDDRPERLHWAAAHEIGESTAWRFAAETGESELAEHPERREALANEFASRLLLPTRWFQPASAACARDLFALKARFRTASHELIAFRWLDFHPPAIVTIFDQNRLTRRRSNTSHQPPRLQPVEHACRQHVHETGAARDIETDDFKLSGWPIHEAAWKREILLLQGRNEDD